MATRTLPERVSTLEETVGGLQHLPQALAAFRSEFDTFRTDVHAFRAEFNAFRTEVYSRFEQIDARFERIDMQFERVYAQMRMLHEDLIERIKALGNGRDAVATTPPVLGARSESHDHKRDTFRSGLTSLQSAVSVAHVVSSRPRRATPPR